MTCAFQVFPCHNREPAPVFVQPSDFVVFQTHDPMIRRSKRLAFRRQADNVMRMSGAPTLDASVSPALFSITPHGRLSHRPRPFHPSGWAACSDPSAYLNHRSRARSRWARPGGARYAHLARREPLSQNSSRTQRAAPSPPQQTQGSPTRLEDRRGFLRTRQQAW